MVYQPVLKQRFDIYSRLGYPDMKFFRCPNTLCTRLFQVNRFDAANFPSGESGRLYCPHCGLPIEVEDKAVFLTHALSSEEEERLNANYGAHV